MTTGMRERDTQWIADVVGFWFDELTPKDWWGGSAEVDAQVRTRFGALQARLAEEPPVPACLDALGHLAAVIAFDQFPRNLHRGSREAFATDPLARAMTIDAIDRGLDASLTRPQRQFLYMPLMHGEDPAMQRRSLAMFGALGDPAALRSARAHQATFARFGRFPYRNAALCRASTDEERAFLAAKPGPE